MAAIGWYVQLVHYPAFRYVHEDKWSEFHAMHCGQTGVLVVPGMLLQCIGVAGATVALDRWPAVVFGLCALFSLGWTLVVSGPLHGKLPKPEHSTIDRLIRTNPPRALAWTAQAALAAAMLIV